MSLEIKLPNKILTLENFTGNETELKSLLHPHISQWYDVTFVDGDNVWKEVNTNEIYKYSSLRAVPVEAPPEHPTTVNHTFPPLSDVIQFPKEKLIHFLKQEPFREYFFNEVGHFLKTFQPQRDEILVYHLINTQINILKMFNQEDDTTLHTTLNDIFNNLAIETITSVDEVYPVQSSVSQALKKLMTTITQVCVYSVRM